MSKTVYIAGPMSGIPQFNYPVFDAAASLLRDRGYTVVSPAEMDSEEMRAMALASSTGDWADLEGSGETWGDVLAKDVKIVADEIDQIVLLPGWERSRGARLETFVALTVRKPVAELVEGLLCLSHPVGLMRAIAEETVHPQNEARYG